MDHLNDLGCFAAVAETKGFAPAARRLGLSTAGVSKSVIRLEARLGVRLFTRTTRRVALTAEGERFYLRCKTILEDVAAAESEIIDTAKTLKGRIRIDMPITYGERHVLPLLAEFKKTNPEITLDIRMSDTFTNLVEEGVDLAIRFGDLNDSRLKVRKLRGTRLVTCASPAYLSKHGVPLNIVDLGQHVCVSFVFRSSGRQFQWRFKAAGRTVEFNPQQGLAVNDGGANRRLALLGACLIQDLDVNVAQELAAGDLFEVLETFSTEAFPIAIVWPAGRHQPTRVRALIDHLTHALVL
jgi:LysR family transcriptional regulator, regulator for bpeEF and oprC